MWHGHLDANVEKGKLTPVHLTEEDVITITVTGKAKNGPEAPEVGPDGDPHNQDPSAIKPDANVGAFLMQVGEDDTLIVVGSGKSDWSVGKVGRVTFLYNDVPGEYGNNTGRFEINLTRETEKPVTCTLEATAKDGVKSGVTVSSGDKISVKATGKASPWSSGDEFGPDGDPNVKADSTFLLPGVNAYSLLVKIGNGDYRLAGKGQSDYPVPDNEEGEIAFFYNDRRGDFGDNRGSFEITLTKE